MSFVDSFSLGWAQYSGKVMNTITTLLSLPYVKEFLLVFILLFVVIMIFGGRNK
jgi:hypothetical protein